MPEILEQKAAYHHGNLKEELIDAAVTLIGELGIQGCTLREIARRAGVSHNAPYRHFNNKEELLASVATQGFELLAESMERAMSRGRRAEDRFQLCARGYLEFALRWPQHLQMMFDFPRLQAGSAAADYEEAAERAFAVLLGAARELNQEVGLSNRDLLNFAVVAWSAIHGFAKLMAAGRVPVDENQAADFSVRIAETLRTGLPKKTRWW